MPCEFSLYVTADQYSVEYLNGTFWKTARVLCASLYSVLQTFSTLVSYDYQFCLLKGWSTLGSTCIFSPSITVH